MKHTIILDDDLTIEATNVETGEILKEGGYKQAIKFDFKVTSEEYHRVTSFLYQNDFNVKVPELDLEFPATIQTYSTSITNLYEQGQVGDYSLELVEK